MFTEEKIKEIKEMIENAITEIDNNINDEENGEPEVALEYVVGLTDMASVLGAITEEEVAEYIKRATKDFEIE